MDVGVVSGGTAEDGQRDAEPATAGVAERLIGRLDALLLCVVGYAATVSGLVVGFLFLNRAISWLFRIVEPSAAGSPTAIALFFGPRLLAGVPLVAGLVGTDLVLTRRLADSPRTNVRGTLVWAVLATALAWVPLIPLALVGVGAFLFPLALLEEPLAALVVLVPLAALTVTGGSIGFYAPVGVVVEDRSLRASLRVGVSRLRAYPLLTVRALAALVAGWLLGGATLLLGLLVVLIGVATAWIGIGLLILPVGAAICLLAVLPMAGGHVYYRLATLRA